MPKIHEIRETRAGKVAEMQALVAAAETAKRDLDGNEAARFDALKAEVRNLEAAIGRAETLDEFERHAEATSLTGGGSTGELEARFSLGRALSEFTSTGRLSGAEAEWNSERRSSRSGAFSVPLSVLMGERRSVTTAAPAAGPGGNLVATQLLPIVDRPRPVLASERLGATVLTGLVGNVDIPKLASSGIARWVPETGPIATSDPKFGKLSLAPKTCAATYQASRRLLIQGPAVEQILRRDLGQILAEALDAAALLGIGGDVPLGVTRTPGVRKVSGSFAVANSPTIAELDELFGTMVGLIDAADIEGARAFVAHPLVRTTLGRYRGADGAQIGLDTFLLGERSLFTSQLPSNGGSGTNLATVIFAAWQDLIVAVWDNVSILVDPYTAADQSSVKLHAFTEADIGLRRPESFVFTDSLPIKALGASVVV